MEALLPLIAMFGLMWLLLIRPQQRRVRQHQAIVAALEAGDEVITAGGIHGTITDVEDDTVLIEISPDVVVRVLTGAISQRLTSSDELDDDDLDGDLEDDLDDIDDEDDDTGLADDDTVLAGDTVRADDDSEGARTPEPGDGNRENGTKPGRVEAIGDDQP
ncbi:MAG TPA: preprotein translocase subunit YajC [Acidimicrobiales bacterium]|nr:preprotein translocase subunit YajC [Acidimicrobiales bacterium]